MGLAFSAFLDAFQARAKVLVLGLDNAGKTTLLYQLKLNESVTTIPTIGFNVETVTMGNVECTMWDVGGQDRIRTLWKHYYAGTDALIFVVDSSDVERLDEARIELSKLLAAEELRGAALLVFANKQDLPKAVGASAMAAALGIDCGFTVSRIETLVIKPFTHAQMAKMLDLGIIDQQVLDGLNRLTRHLPTFGSEICAVLLPGK